MPCVEGHNRPVRGTGRIWLTIRPVVPDRRISIPLTPIFGLVPGAGWQGIELVRGAGGGHAGSRGAAGGRHFERPRDRAARAEGGELRRGRSLRRDGSDDLGVWRIGTIAFAALPARRA